MLEDILDYVVAGQALQPVVFIVYQADKRVYRFGQALR